MAIQWLQSLLFLFSVFGRILFKKWIFAVMKRVKLFI